MKKLLFVFAVISTLIFVSCESNSKKSDVNKINSMVSKNSSDAAYVIATFKSSVDSLHRINKLDSVSYMLLKNKYSKQAYDIMLDNFEINSMLIKSNINDEFRSYLTEQLSTNKLVCSQLLTCEDLMRLPSYK